MLVRAIKEGKFATSEFRADILALEMETEGRWTRLSRVSRGMPQLNITFNKAPKMLYIKHSL